MRDTALRSIEEASWCSGACRWVHTSLRGVEGRGGAKLRHATRLLARPTSAEGRSCHPHCVVTREALVAAIHIALLPRTKTVLPCTALPCTHHVALHCMTPHCTACAHHTPHPTPPLLTS